MGEHATRKEDGQRVKIGTCESMYYLRHDDKSKVNYSFSNYEFFWRLPFPDEDNIRPGEYDKYNRGLSLYKPIKDEDGTIVSYEHFIGDNTVDCPGTVQTSHPCGLLINVKCYHGIKLPDSTGDMKAFWNGKFAGFFELAFVKNTDNGLVPVVRCRACDNMWRCEWDEVLPYIAEPEMKERLERYTGVYAK